MILPVHIVVENKDSADCGFGKTDKLLRFSMHVRQAPVIFITVKSLKSLLMMRSVFNERNQF
jgi:hypothetical protein